MVDVAWVAQLNFPADTPLVAPPPEVPAAPEVVEIAPRLLDAASLSIAGLFTLSVFTFVLCVLYWRRTRPAAHTSENSSSSDTSVDREELWV